MPKVSLHNLPSYEGSNRVSDLLGTLGAFEGRSISAGFALVNLGANVETLAPGSASSHRHWHDRVDELVVVLDGVLTLIEETGRLQLCAGDIGVFPAGDENGHCLVNESAESACFLVVASRHADDRCHYAEADLIAESDGTLRRADGAIVS